MINRIKVGDFVGRKDGTPIFDVRTPLEYNHAHIPGAINLPIFSDEERAQIGTTYKQKGREKAILLGFDYTGPKWRNFIETALLHAPDKKVLVHCWRGGMRSGAMAWALDFYGFDVEILEGGYKNYRNYVLQQFEVDYPFCVLGGMTGSHKTDILIEMKKLGEQIIDLEGIAQHLGSAYGSLNKLTQPSQEQFENILAENLASYNREKRIWIENESSLIGRIAIPPHIFKQIQTAVLVELRIDKEKRVKFLTQEYGTLDKDFLIQSTQKIQKRFGPEQTKDAITTIREDRMEDFIRIVLNYYDKTYINGISKRDPIKCFAIEINFDNQQNAAKQIIEFANKNHLLATR
ncbi:MAG: tRNA 2-selenouridine(34) synthase MnmH [Bacteroidetes bacterium]|nr:tRNA 2-selenouridine(34) synthase MnmH [Bacteroidota bacterium]